MESERQRKGAEESKEKRKKKNGVAMTVNTWMWVVWRTIVSAQAWNELIVHFYVLFHISFIFLWLWPCWSFSLYEPEHLFYIFIHVHLKQNILVKWIQIWSPNNLCSLKGHFWFLSISIWKNYQYRKLGIFDFRCSLMYSFAFIIERNKLNEHENEKRHYG